MKVIKYASLLSILLLFIQSIESMLEPNKEAKQKIFNQIGKTNQHVATDIANFIMHRKNIGLRRLQGEIEKTGIETTNRLIDELNHHPQYFLPDKEIFLGMMKDSEDKKPSSKVEEPSKGKIFKESRFSQMESKYSNYIKNIKELTPIEDDIIEDKEGINIEELQDGPIPI